MEELIKTYSCTVCMDLFANPTMLRSCGHTFCGDCLNGLLNHCGAKCSICRKDFTKEDCIEATKVAKAMKSKKNAYNCGCGEKVLLTSLSDHQQSCSYQAEQQKKAAELKFKPIKQTKQRPSMVNRSTFACPCCDEKHLDCKSLVEHANKFPDTHAVKACCPVCAAMPWGDPNKKTNNFLDHISFRHKFEFDTYVDFEEDEDAMLRKVLEQSKSEYVDMHGEELILQEAILQQTISNSTNSNNSMQEESDEEE